LLPGQEFIMPEVNTHPSARALALFGYGKLSEAQAATVAAHLESCADCRQAVANLPPDSFLGKVQAARPGGTVLPAGAPRPKADPEATEPAPAALVPELPSGLADHPKFRIVRELGRGGMGVIYLAEHRVLEKSVALKVINPAVLDSPDALARFRAEAKAAARLDHPNIARAHDADQAGGLHFLVMEFVEGMSLAQVLARRGPLPVAHACHYVRQAALGLQHAHEHGMVHRDIKPQNLMLAPKGLLKVLDFGLARVQSERQGGPRLTRLDSFMGTPLYVAPEQATDARKADTRSDIYSLGCTLYALLAGRPPFMGESVSEIVLAHIEKAPRPLHEVRPDVPAALSAVVAKMLAKHPDRRYQQPVEVAQALVPFIKAGIQKVPAGRPPAPPGVVSPGMRTMLGGDTQGVKRPDERVSPHPVRAPAAAEEEESPFAHLFDPQPSVAPRPKGPTRWWKHSVVRAGTAGALLALIVVGAIILKVKATPGVPTARALASGGGVDTPKPPPVEVNQVPQPDPPKLPAPGKTDDDPLQEKPDTPEPHFQRAEALYNQRSFQDAADELRKAIGLKPDYHRAHCFLGNVLMEQGKAEAAVQAWRDALQLLPTCPAGNNNLYRTLSRMGRTGEAETLCRDLIALQPDNAVAHCNLGENLQGQGRFAEALAELRRGHELGSKAPDWRYPSPERIGQCERLLEELAGRLPAVLAGGAEPKDAVEAAEFATLCRTRRLNAAAARLFAEVLAADPRLADDLNRGHRYSAACAAALAAAGQGVDSRRLPDKLALALRRQALRWLRADLALCTADKARGLFSRNQAVGQRLALWRQNTDLDSVRDKDALDKLTDDERKEWRQFWDDVAALKKQIDEGK
jgi:serine/threonine protein kinase/tetratricopeptide (TPR) repeat protein